MKGQRVRECPVRDSRSRMYNQSGWFVDDDQIFVFVNYVDGNVFRSEHLRRMRRQFDFDFIVGANFVRRLRQSAADENIAVVNQPLEPRTTPTFDSFREKRVEPLACRFGCYRESEVRILIDGRSHPLTVAQIANLRRSGSPSTDRKLTFCATDNATYCLHGVMTALAARRS